MYNFDLKRKFENDGVDEEIKDTFQFYNVYNYNQQQQQQQQQQQYQQQHQYQQLQQQPLNNYNNSYDTQIKKKIKYDYSTTTVTTITNTNIQYQKQQLQQQQKIKDEDIINNLLSVELIVKIFGLCDPFSTPLLLVCKYWYEILCQNQTSLWRDIRVSISDKKPFSYTPKCESIISFFKTGYAKGLHHFSITPSLSTPKTMTSTSSSSSSSSLSSFSSRSRYRDHSTQRLLSPCNYRTTLIN